MITETFMDGGPWAVNLQPDTPRWVLDDLDVRNKLWATIVITPQHFVPGTVSDANLLTLARYAGVYLGMGAGRTSLHGEGLLWWLGDAGDGGDLHAGIDVRYENKYLVDVLNDLVFNGPNGLTLNYTGSIAELFEIDIEGGDTKREVLDTILGQCSSEVVYSLTPAGVLNVGTPSGLWTSRGTPTVIFTPEGGHDALINGLQAEFVMAELNGDEVRNDVWVDWDDGHNSGRQFFDAPWFDFAGQEAEVRFLMDWRPKRAKPPTEKWRKLAAWQVQSETKANRLAARELNERTEVRQEIAVEVDAFDPWRYAMSPGNDVYLYDPDTKILDTANEVYYRGEAIRPDRGTVQQWTTPIRRGYGVYLRYFTSIGGAATYYDLTNWVEFEDGPTSIKVGHRDSFAPKMAARTMSKLKKKRIRQAAQKAYTATFDNRNPNHLRTPPSLGGPAFDRLPPPVRPTRWNGRP